MVKTFGWVLGVVFLGCGARTLVTATGAPQAPRPEGCDFEILTSTPLNGFREIGTLDMLSGGDGDTTSLTRFKKRIAPKVCQLGGDAALAMANGTGYYIKATVLKRAETATLGAEGDASNGKHGCEFDTQCKGDRICIAGSCQAPTPSAPTPSSAVP